MDIDVCVELPYSIFSDPTGELYESRIVHRMTKFQDKVRTPYMNPHDVVASENTNRVITVNRYSYEDPSRYTENMNFALSVSNHFTEPFKDSNEYGKNIARLSNALGSGVIVQCFGDLIRRQRSTDPRTAESFVTPTLSATPDDLSLITPKHQVDDTIEMIYALDKAALGIANDDTLLYGVEVKSYNLEVKTNHNLETRHERLYVIGSCSGATHSLSHTSVSGVYVARHLYSNKH